MMSESNRRLRRAREAAGFPTMEAAAERHGWKLSTYRSHENGQTDRIPQKKAEIYAKAFKVSAAWILTGEGSQSSLLSVAPSIGDGASRALRFMMTVLRLKEAGLAKLLGIPEDTVLKWLSGAKRPTKAEWAQVQLVAETEGIILRAVDEQRAIFEISDVMQKANITELRLLADVAKTMVKRE